MSVLSRKWNLDVSQPHWPPQPVTRIDLPFLFTCIPLVINQFHNIVIGSQGNKWFHHLSLASNNLTSRYEPFCLEEAHFLLGRVLLPFDEMAITMDGVIIRGNIPP
jgi:hypothetical protein